MVEASQIRKKIRELLDLLASGEQQLAYERDVPRVDITAELISMWFDDQYHPTDRFFSEAFSPLEMAALDEFHQFYASRVDDLPESKGSVRTWLACPAWRDVMAVARATHEKIA